MSNGESKISERSWIPLGKAIAIGIGLFSGGYVVAQALGKIERRLDSVEIANSERWTVSDMERFSYQLERDNRSLPVHVPDARSLKQMRP